MRLQAAGIAYVAGTLALIVGQYGVGIGCMALACTILLSYAPGALGFLGRTLVLYPLQGLWHSLRTNLAPLAWLWPFYSRVDYKREGEARRVAARELELQRRYEPDEDWSDQYTKALDIERKSMAELDARMKSALRGKEELESLIHAMEATVND